MEITARSPALATSSQARRGRLGLSDAHCNHPTRVCIRRAFRTQVVSLCESPYPKGSRRAPFLERPASWRAEKPTDPNALVLWTALPMDVPIPRPPNFRPVMEQNLRETAPTFHLRINRQEWVEHNSRVGSIAEGEFDSGPFSGQTGAIVLSEQRGKLLLAVCNNLDREFCLKASALQLPSFVEMMPTAP